jgi:hypothetical protein
VKWSTPTVGPVFSSPALGDLNGDGILDVVAVAKAGDSLSIGPNAGDGSYVYALNGATGAPLPGFPAHLCEMTGRSFPVRSAPVIADIIGNGHPQILVAHAREIDIIKSDGTYYNGISQVSPNVCYPFAKPAGDTTLVYGRIDNYSGTFYSTPAVDDLNGDGNVEVITVGRYGEDLGFALGELYVWSGHQNGARPWPMFRKNADHTGSFSFKVAGLSFMPLLYK